MFQGRIRALHYTCGKAVTASQVLAMAQQPLTATRVEPWQQPILQHRLALMRLSATAAAAAAAVAPVNHPSAAARVVSGPAQMVAAADTDPVQGQYGGMMICRLMLHPFLSYKP